jgi:hypothetical protein
MTSWAPFLSCYNCLAQLLEGSLTKSEQQNLLISEMAKNIQAEKRKGNSGESVLR